MGTGPLLRVLADGEFHSGEQLGQLLSVSRAAVWKQIKKLESNGLAIESVKGRGYRLLGGVDLLDEGIIRSGLSTDTLGLVTELDLHEIIESTNRLAMDRALQGKSSGYVCLAEQQTAGRGRRGREWFSPYAGSIYLSVVWEFTGGAAALEGLSLAVGVAVVEALTELGISTAELKWPNDVLSGGRKLAGILLEMTGDAAGPCQVVVGVGINVAISPATGEQIDQPWVDVSTLTGQEVSRNRLISHLLNKLLPGLAHYEAEGFRAYRERWQELDAFSGQQVVVSLGQETIVGASAGVDETGALLVDTLLGRRQFNGGEVSLRRMDDS